MEEGIMYNNIEIKAYRYLAATRRTRKRCLNSSTAFLTSQLAAFILFLCFIVAPAQANQGSAFKCRSSEALGGRNIYVTERLILMSYRLELMEKIELYRLDQRDPYWEDMRSLAEHGTLSEQMCKGLLYQLEPLIKNQKDFPNLLHRVPDETELHADGKPDIELGHLVEKPELRFGLRLSDRVRNVVLAGSAGSGKTVTIRNICFKIHEYNQLHPEKRITIVILDPKQDYTDLRDKLGEEWFIFSVHDNLKLGINGPPEVPPAIWINPLSTSLAARLGLVISRTCFANMIRWLLPILNPEPPNRELIWPSLGLLLEIAQSTPLSCFSSKADYGKTLIQLLEGLIMDGSDLFDCSNGFMLQRDVIQARKNCVIDISNLPDYLRHFIADLLIGRVLVSRLHNRYKTDRTDTIFCIDEADLLVSSKTEEAFGGGLSMISLLARLGRELGLQATVGISSLQNTAPHFLSSACYTMVYNVSDTNSVIAGRRALLLPPGAEHMLTALRPGQCLFRESQGPWPHTMWGQLDYIPPAR